MDGSKFYVNKNVKQKYKIIFGLDFLIENKFDFLLSTGMIDLQWIQIAINRNATLQDKNECQNNGKQLNDNTYRKYTGKSVVNRKNAEHLSEDEKNILVNLMFQFEEPFQETVGNYKKMESVSISTRTRVLIMRNLIES